MNRPCLLDLDGTLMPSHAVDNDCYWAAVDEVFETKTGSLDLAGFRNVTDDGILGEWCQQQLGRAPTRAERQAVCRRFLAHIERAATRHPEAFVALPGVAAWLAQRPRGSVAIATGGWGHTAQFKLGAAGLDRFNLPLASSDDGDRRTAIMRAAQALLGASWREATPVYFGDGRWDYDAARTLGWDFIGIASGARARALREAGARQVRPDFLDLLDEGS